MTHAAAPSADLRATLAALAPRARRERLVATVRNELARVLGLAGSQAVDPARGFFDLGLDSLMAMQLRRRLGEVTGLELPATVTFNHPSVGPLAEHLLGLLGLAQDFAQDLVHDRAPSGPAPVLVEPARDNVADLSDDEVRRALQAELAAAGLADDDNASVLATAAGASR